jgi:cytochrome c-type biogenesis protein CcsB
VAVDTTLAQMSNTLIYSAMLVYTGALGAFTTDLSVRGRRRAAAVAAAAAAVAEPSPEKITAEPVAVGAGSGRPSLTDPAPPAPPAPPATTAAAPTGAAPAPTTAAPGADVPGSQLRSKVGGIAVSLTWLAFALHLAGVVTRGASVSRVPWGNAYEFAITGAVVVTAVFLATLLRRDTRYLGTFVVGPVLLTLGLAVTVFYVQADQLVPALHSFWLIIHVSVAFVAAALLTLGFSTTILQLVQDRRERARAAGAEPTRGRFMEALPSSTSLEGSSYSLHMIAFPLWTFTLVAGAIWAESAWGRYWNWDPKEVWTFVIWVVYAAYLHARATRGWDGRRAAYFALVGYACVIINFTVVNLFFKGWHSYSGL